MKVSNFSDTTEELAELEQNACVEAVQRRWELQSTRFGNRLSECLTISVAELNAWTDYVNEIHETSQVTTTTQTPNAGLSVLSEMNDFTSRERLGRAINFRFRNLLTRARPYLDRYEAFRQSVVDNEEEILAELTQVSWCICFLSIDNFYDFDNKFIFSAIVLWLPLSTMNPEMTSPQPVAAWKFKIENETQVHLLNF